MNPSSKENGPDSANAAEAKKGYQPALILEPKEEARKVAKLEATLTAKFALLGACLERLHGGRYRLTYRDRTRFLSDFGQAYELYREVTEGTK